MSLPLSPDVSSQPDISIADCPKGGRRGPCFTGKKQDFGPGSQEYREVEGANMLVPRYP